MGKDVFIAIFAIAYVIVPRIHIVYPTIGPYILETLVLCSGARANLVLLIVVELHQSKLVFQIHQIFISCLHDIEGALFRKRSMRTGVLFEAIKVSGRLDFAIIPWIRRDS